MRTIPYIAFAAAFSLGLAACSGGTETAGEDSAPPGDAATSGPAVATEAGNLTPDYLEGEWCYLSYEAGGELSEENITYVFAKDGTLKYQTTSDGPVDQDGTYALDEGVFVVKPALAFFKMLPVTMNDDGMILEAMGGQFSWRRGGCE